MKKRYLSLVLAAILSLGQIAGTVQPVQASGISGEAGLQGQQADMLSEGLGQEEPNVPVAQPGHEEDSGGTEAGDQTGTTQPEDGQTEPGNPVGPAQPEDGQAGPEDSAEPGQLEENGKEGSGYEGAAQLEESEGSKLEGQENGGGTEPSQQEENGQEESGNPGQAETAQPDESGQEESRRPAVNGELAPKNLDGGQQQDGKPEGQGEGTQELFLQPAQPAGPEQAGQETQVQAESGYQPYLYSGDEIQLFPSLTYNIWREGMGIWRKDDAEEVPLVITDVKVKSGSEAVISAEPHQWEEGSGWILSPKQNGLAKVVLTCEAAKSVSPDEATPGIQPVEKEISISISEKQYSMGCISTNTGTNYVLPGEAVELKATVQVATWDDEYGIEYKETNDADVIWKAESDFEGFPAQEKTLKSGESFQVQVPENGEFYNIRVTAQVKDGDRIAASGEFYLYVPNEYYIVELNASDGLEELWLGQEGTITPVLLHYVKGQKEPETVNNVQYRFSSEEGDFNIYKDGKAIDNDTLQDSGTFTIKRLKNTYRGISMEVLLAGDIVLYEHLSFQEKNYGDVSIEGANGEYGTYIYIDEENPGENSENLTFTLNTEKLGGEYQIAWELLVGQEPVPNDGKIYQVSGEKNDTVTIKDVAALHTAYKAAQDLAGEEEYVECRIRAVVSAGGEEQSNIGQSLYFRAPSYELDDVEWEVIEGTAIIYKDKKIAVNVSNKEYPEGGNVSLDIKEVKVIEQSPDSGTANANVFTVKQEGNDIKLIAENCGWATLECTVALPFGGEKKFILDKTVVQHIYQCDLWTSTGNNYLLPDAELKLESEVWHKYYDPTLQDAAWEKLDAGKYTVSYQSFNEEVASIAQDGTVKAKGKSGTETEIEVVWKIPQGEKTYEKVDYSYISIVDSYRHVSAEPLTAAPGETVEKITCAWKKFDLDHRDGVDEAGDITYELYTSDRKIKVNEAGTGFTVAPDAQDGKKIRLRISAMKTDENGRKLYANGAFFLNICQHNFIQKSITQATCTKAGSKTLECSKCHAVTRTEAIPATGHKAGEWVIAKQATCTAAGEQAKKCTSCGIIMDTKVVAATGHKAGNWETTKQATCTAAGEQAQKCTACGLVLGTKSIPATGHSFGAWKQAKEPTALKKGTKTRTCSKCNATETQEIKKLKAKIKLNVTSIPLQVKKSTTAVKVTSMAKGDGVKSWKSSKPKVASVTSKGKITGKKVGTAKIKVTLKSNISATVTVKVQKKAVTTKKLSVTAKSLKKKNLTLKRKKSVTLKVTREPVTSTEKITYKSSNSKIAAVSKKGKITAKKAGKAKITVKSGKKKVVINVTVKK